MKGKLAFYSVLVLVLVLITACASQAPAPAPTTAPAAAPAAKAAAAAPTVPPGQKELVYTGPGGQWQKNFADLVIPNFEKKFGVKVTYLSMPGSMDIVTKVIAQRSSPEIDVFFANNVSTLKAIEAGVAVDIDAARVPNFDALYSEFKDRGRNAAPFGIGPDVLTYNPKVFQEKGFAPPTSWSDLWRPELKGKVTMLSINQQLTYAILPIIAKMESGDPKNTDAWVAKMKTVVPNVINFSPTINAVEDLFKTGAAWISNYGLVESYTSMSSGLPMQAVIPKEGSPYYTNYYMVAKGAPHPELAQEFVNYALSPEVQLALAERSRFGPSNKNVKLPPEVAKDVVFGPEQVASKLVSTDYKWLNDQLPSWTDRWNKEIEAKK